MFEFTWARLGIFFAILIGFPVVAFGMLMFVSWLEDNDEAQPWALGGCVFILLTVIAGFIAFIK